MEFIEIPAGSFVMGSDDDHYERPPHLVTISQPFSLGKYEVTQGQWKAVMGSNPSHFSQCGDDCPVESVSWDDVQEFIAKLNTLEDTDKYRLPTEAEWEYAARAGTTTVYSFGDDAAVLGQYAWYWYNSGGQSHPVGQKLPNPWGLYDMYGNIWEWVHDRFGFYTNGPATDPTGPSEGSQRVFRGGCLIAAEWHLRSANRCSNVPDIRSENYGFRLARSFDHP